MSKRRPLEETPAWPRARERLAARRKARRQAYEDTTWHLDYGGDWTASRVCEACDPGQGLCGACHGAVLREVIRAPWPRFGWGKPGSQVLKLVNEEGRAS